MVVVGGTLVNKKKIKVCGFGNSQSPQWKKILTLSMLSGKHALEKKAKTVTVHHFAKTSER